jgi:hypothetical protein
MSANMDQWIYLVVTRAGGPGTLWNGISSGMMPAFGIEDVIDVLDSCGEAGWELAAVENDSTTLYFKKLKE